MWRELKTIYRLAVAVMRLDEKAFVEIHADHRATYQAVIVVFVSSLGLAVHLPGGWLTAIEIPVAFIIWWLLATSAIYFLGKTLLSTKNTLPPIKFASLARGIGFSMAPRIFLIFLFVEPFYIARIILFLSIVWIFAAMLTSTRIAFRQASSTRVMWTVGLAMLPVMVLDLFILFV